MSPDANTPHRSVVPSADINLLMDSNKEIQVAPGAEVEVICAGIGRTGTMSLFRALNILGYRCHHMAVVMDDKKRAIMLRDLVKKDNSGKGTEDVDWVKLWAGYTAGLDSPFADYYLETANAFPNAKVVLTTRDPDKWWKSFNKIILEDSVQSKLFRMASFCLPSLWYQQQLAAELVKLWERKYGSPMGPHTIVGRTTEVKETIPAERLLEYDVAQGWEPLCTFLGKPIPQQAFPRLNDQAVLGKAIFMVKVFGVVVWSGVLALGGGLGYMAWTWLRPDQRIWL